METLVSDDDHTRRRKTRVLAVIGGCLVLVALALAAAAQGKRGGGSAAGGTTLTQTIVKGDELSPGFFELTTGPGSDIVVRQDLATAQEGRESKRRSLTYIAQLTDFQLADEESPARVEFADPGASSAWRPQEAFHPFAIDQSMRRLNGLLSSPIAQGNGERARLRLGILTGDQADNQQYNETLWVRQLIESGSTLNPSSGIDDYSSCDPVAQAALRQKRLAKEPNYVGVQDYKDFSRSEQYYDPDDPAGGWSHWPRYTGLMNRAQRPFKTTGLSVPTYVVDGNHDGLVQGNEDANQAFEQIATSCEKIRATTSTADRGTPESPNPNLLQSPAGAEAVPPDPDRRFVSKGEVRNIFASGKQDDKHGFKYVDSSEDGSNAARGSAWYYAWDPQPQFRFIVIDTLSEGGNVQDSSEGNIDDPQFQWLERELKKASCAGESSSCTPKLIMVFGHHPIRSLTSQTPDENAGLCAGGYNNSQRQYDGADRDPKPDHNHALNPGCDEDVRASIPLHHGHNDGSVEGLAELLGRYPGVIAYVPGHTHENKVAACGDPKDGCPAGKSGFWELNTSAVADWPQQNRLIDVMDNFDCTLSIFSVVTDHASDIGIPGAGNASSFTGTQLGAIGRTFSFNDPQAQLAARGEDKDRNVELLIRDPHPTSTCEQQTTTTGTDTTTTGTDTTTTGTETTTTETQTTTEQQTTTTEQQQQP